MTSHGKELIPDIVSFFIENMHDKSINEWRKEIDISNEKELNTIRQEFVDHQSSLPSKAEVKLFSTYTQFNISKKKFPITIPNGDQGIIEVSHDYCNEIIELIDQRIEELNKNKLKEFPKFGEWNSLENPKYFKLKKDILPFVALVFEKVKVDRGIQYNELYYSLINILYKYNDNLYSFSGIRKAKKVASENKNKSRSKVNFTQKESFEFINYLLDVENNTIILKKQSHS